MIRVERVAPPYDFNERVRKPGQAWLARRGADVRFPRYWRRCQRHLAAAFANRCAYTAMHVHSGQVDHFRSKTRFPTLAYEWTNYRYASGEMNAAKGDRDVLDPFEIEDGWFEIDLASLVLRATDKVPGPMRALANETLRLLDLADGEAVLDYRKSWLEMYEQRELSIEGLRRVAPLLAAAVEREQAPSARVDGRG